MAEILIAQESFAANRQVIQRGRTIRAGHPLTRGREHLFKPFVPDFEHVDPKEQREAEEAAKAEEERARQEAEEAAKAAEQEAKAAKAEAKKASKQERRESKSQSEAPSSPSV